MSLDNVATEPQLPALATSPSPVAFPSPYTPTGRFVAIDFETADHAPDSACSVGIIVVDGLEIVQTVSYLIRPPRRRILFSYVHGIQWKHVADQPTFAEIWPTASKLFDDAEFIAAHNASFDEGVLRACCASARLPMPPQPFHCTVGIARKKWGFKPASLPDVCRQLNIPLKHHNAESDATACAKILIEARKMELRRAMKKQQLESANASPTKILTES
jgi:DNA polymerase III subunit epsilon